MLAIPTSSSGSCNGSSYAVEGGKGLEGQLRLLIERLARTSACASSTAR